MHGENLKLEKHMFQEQMENNDRNNSKEMWR